ncbi:hypothetical protein XA68_16761 [Ophiocordyceps unilateralis]|uniref:CDP-diacylglycerol--glycerol-3-phosphate 3-phosphatidyltransferase n=1 Tax=Ophiocordyceps unilateralis TaxID=268505 RepID=A0A2A9P548_OPHUN|nr:hypothetical protein XA68_16761 [Ophiocordyceps unilateralis]
MKAAHTPMSCAVFFCPIRLGYRLSLRPPVPTRVSSLRPVLCHRLAFGHRTALGTAAATSSLQSPGCSSHSYLLSGQSSHRCCSSNSPLPKSGQDGSHKTPMRTMVKVPTVKAGAKPAAVREDIFTLPNFLTLTRLLAAPAIGVLVIHDAPAWAVGLFAYAAATDVLDGWIARRWNLKTVVGTVIDPMADKALMTIMTVCLAFKGALPVWVATIILGRDVCLGIAAVYYRWVSLPPPKTFVRYWNFSLPSAEVHPTIISKYNTFLQLILVGLTTAAPLTDADLSLPLTILQYTVAVTTMCSGLSYIFSKDAVKILK